MYIYQFVNDLAFFREIDPQLESTGFQSPKPSLNLEVKLFEMMWSFVQLVAVRQTKNTKHNYDIQQRHVQQETSIRILYW